METVFVVHHSYELYECEETKLIGVYTSQNEAEAAIERLKTKPGFQERPDDFSIDTYALNKGQWSEGYSTMVTIEVKDIHGHWKTVAAALRADNTYEIIEKDENDLLGEFKDGDSVRCEERGGVLYAVEKVSQ